jgi:hypothetical protein
VGTYSGNSLASGFKIFIDGVEDTSATVLGDNLGTNTILSAASFNIGARNGAALYFNGSLDEVSVYSSVLTPTRILAHYNSRARPVCRTFSTLTNSSWSHIAGLFNSTTGAFKLFFNGTQECSMTLSSPTNLYAGSTESLKAAPTPFWSGDIAEVRASNTVVTNNNVIDHYNTESGNYPSFLPSSISGLVLWLDASDSATLFQNSNCTSSPVTANGDIVACWKDKSASNLHATQGTSARQPIYASSSINSKPGVTFGSVDYDVLTTSSITLTARSYFVVTKNNGASRGSVHSLILQGASPYYQIYGSPNYLYYQINNPNTGVVISGNQLVSLTSSSGIVSIRFNGNTYLNYTGTASSVSSGFHIGGYVAGGYGLNGDILEMIVFDNAISETDLKRVEAYLNSKYKIY